MKNISVVLLCFVLVVFTASAGSVSAPMDNGNMYEVQPAPVSATQTVASFNPFSAFNPILNSDPPPCPEGTSTMPSSGCHPGLRLLPVQTIATEETFTAPVVNTNGVVIDPEVAMNCPGCDDVPDPGIGPTIPPNDCQDHGTNCLVSLVSGEVTITVYWVCN